MRTFEEVCGLVESRRRSRGALMDRMAEVATRYNGDYVIPMPGLDDETPLPPITPLLIAEAIDNVALRAGSVTPSTYCPALDAAKEKGRRSLEYAKTRRRALSWVKQESFWGIQRRRSFRHLAGYATTAVVVIPEFNTKGKYGPEAGGYPHWQVRDPLCTYPEPKSAEDVTPIRDCAFVYGKSAEWIAATYPSTRALLSSGDKSALWDLVEWIDEDQILIGLLGPREMFTGSGYERDLGFSTGMRGSARLLSWWPNRAGCCTVANMERITMDKLASQVATTVGMVDLMNHLMGLDIRATERSVFPDRYLIASQNKAPQIVGGAWKEGTSGEVNLLTNVESLGELRGTPDPNNKTVMDRLERNFRVSTGLVPQMGGESYGALRTGRGIDSLMGAAVDPRIQEVQELFAAHEQRLNEITIEVFKGYWPKNKYVVFSGWPTDQGQVAFQPDEHLESTDNVVVYPIPGGDVQSTTINLGQLFGAELISKRTAQRLHPWVPDPEAEEQQSLVENLEKAILESYLQRSAQGGIPPIDQARMLELVTQGKSLVEAITTADREASERQAREAPPPQPGMGMPPEVMPGLGNPGEGGEMLPPPVPQPPAGLDNFRQLTRALRSPQSLPR